MIIQVEIILLTVVAVFVFVFGGWGGGDIIGALSFLCSLDPFPGIYLHSHIYFLVSSPHCGHSAPFSHGCTAALHSQQQHAWFSAHPLKYKISNMELTIVRCMLILSIASSS